MQQFTSHLVTYIACTPYTVMVTAQDVYNTCMRKYRERHQFIAFLDSDEVRAASACLPSFSQVYFGRVPVHRHARQLHLET